MTVKYLKEAGHDVKDIRGTASQGIDDEGVWDLIKKENRILVTTDKGFSRYRNEKHPGILIVRLRRPNRLKIHQRVVQGLRLFSEQKWPGKVLIMRDTVQSLWESKDT